MRRNWKQLGRRVKHDRVLAGMKSREDLARATADVDRSGRGVHPRTLGTLERGNPVSEGTLVLVEAALGWPDGEADRVLRGVAVEPEVHPDEEAIINSNMSDDDKQRVLQVLREKQGRPSVGRTSDRPVVRNGRDRDAM